MWEGEPDVLIKNPSASRLPCRTQWPAFRPLKFQREYGKSGGVYIPVFTQFEQRFMVGKNSQGVWIEFFYFCFRTSFLFFFHLIWFCFFPPSIGCLISQSSSACPRVYQQASYSLIIRAKSKQALAAFWSSGLMSALSVACPRVYQQASYILIIRAKSKLAS